MPSKIGLSITGTGVGGDLKTGNSNHAASRLMGPHDRHARTRNHIVRVDSIRVVPGQDIPPLRETETEQGLLLETTHQAPRAADRERHGSAILSGPGPRCHGTATPPQTSSSNKPMTLVAVFARGSRTRLRQELIFHDPEQHYEPLQQLHSHRVNWRATCNDCADLAPRSRDVDDRHRNGSFLSGEFDPIPGRRPAIGSRDLSPSTATPS